MFTDDYLFVYSETGRAFLNKARLFFKEIVTEECRLPFFKKRILLNNYYIPITLLLFEHKSEIGFYDPTRSIIGLSKRIIYQSSDEQLKDILRHELAHLLTYHTFGDVPSHGKEYHQICAQYFKEYDVSKSTIELTIQKTTADESAIMQKVKKLLALATSSNLHERELATARANEILLKYNLTLSPSMESDDTYMKRVLLFKKAVGKHHAITKILEHFLVKPILSYGRGTIAIEVIGTKENVEIADYVAKFLDFELENEFKQSGLKGVQAKNSFMRGIAEGHDQKMRETLLKDCPKESMALIQNNLTKRFNEVYPRLSKTYTSGHDDFNAKQIGIKKGKELTINRPIGKFKQHLIEFMNG